MKKRTIIILSSILLIILIGGAIGIYLYKKPVKDFADSKAEITLNAKAIFDEFVKDQNAAIAKYVSNDKTIQISGLISDVQIGNDGTVTIILDVANPDGDVSCTLTPEESQKAKDLKPGTNINIKGQCTGFQELINKEVVMIRCGLVK